MGMLDEFNARLEEGKARAHQAYVAKTVKRVCNFFGVDPGPYANDPEFGWDWFYDQYPSFPVVLASRNIRVDVSRMFKAMTRTPAFDALIVHLEETKAVRGGLIIPAFEHGLFAFHNFWDIPEVKGYTRLMRRADRNNDGLIFEEIDSFLKGIKLHGWEP